MPHDRVCKNCRHLDNDSIEDNIGFCRRYPPTVLPDGDSVITESPVVLMNEWCGEFMGKLND